MLDLATDLIAMRISVLNVNKGFLYTKTVVLKSKTASFQMVSITGAIRQYKRMSMSII